MTEETASVEYSEVFIGECTVGSCTRPATVRIWESFALCALHHAMHEVSQKGDDASLALELLQPWRDQARMHRLEGLAENLNRIMDDQEARYEDAQEYVSQLERIEVEDVPNEDIRRQMGVRQQEVRQQEKARDPEPQQSAGTPTVLTAVNQLLAQASVLLMESHGPTEEAREAELELQHAIADAGRVLVEEQARRERSAPPPEEEQELESGVGRSCA